MKKINLKNILKKTFKKKKSKNLKKTKSIKKVSKKIKKKASKAKISKIKKISKKAVSSKNDNQNNKPELSKNLDNLNSIKIINMKENRGHARCNASGLKYIYENEEFDYVIPMDGDGEDRPEEIGFFIDNISYFDNKPIVGERVKRSEGNLFRFFYLIHKY